MRERTLKECDVNVKGKIVMISDDGPHPVHMSVAVDVVRKKECKRVIVAVSTASTQALRPCVRR